MWHSVCFESCACPLKLVQKCFRYRNIFNIMLLSSVITNIASDNGKNYIVVQKIIPFELLGVIIIAKLLILSTPVKHLLFYYYKRDNNCYYYIPDNLIGV